MYAIRSYYEPRTLRARASAMMANCRRLWALASRFAPTSVRMMGFFSVVV